jgi:DNA-binding MarR family transcriptional regulator
MRRTASLIVVCNYMCMQQSSLSLAADRSGSGEVVDSVLSASRALVAVAARSLATVADDVTLPQYRALVELAVRGPQRPADLAAALGVDRSTTTRMCDRLVRKRLISRRHSSADRRSVRIALSADGVALVEEVTRRRRLEIERIVQRIPATDRPLVVAALHTFTEAAGGVADHDWALGWRTA